MNVKMKQTLMERLDALHCWAIEHGFLLPLNPVAKTTELSMRNL